MIINEKFWIVMTLPIIAVIVFMILPTDPTTSTIGVMAVNLLVIFYLRKSFKGTVGKMFGEKLKWQCLICQGTKFDKKGVCWKCGRSQRRPI